MQQKTDKRDVWDDHWAALNKITEINPAQHYRHRLLNKLFLSCIDSRPDINKVFDFGSGQGDLIQMLAKDTPGCEYFGLELSQVGVDISRGKNINSQFFKCNLLEKDGQLVHLFDKAQLGICSEVLEHIDDPVVALTAIRKYLAPGAKIIITVPGGPMNAFEKSIGHRKHYDKKQLSSLLEKSGLHPVKYIRAGFPFFNLYKLIALARGKRLILDADSSKGNNGSFSKKLMLFVLVVFEYLFYINLSDSPFGWQLAVIAVKHD